MTETNPQFEWHRKPKGWPLCPTCGAVVRAGTEHRALTADEGWTWRALWVKRVSVCFGTDFSIEAIRDKRE